MFKIKQVQNLNLKAEKCIFWDYIDNTECYCLNNITNGSIIKNYNIEFFVCKNSKQRKENLKVFFVNSKKQELKLSLKSFHHIWSMTLKI